LYDLELESAGRTGEALAYRFVGRRMKSEKIPRSPSPSRPI